MVNQLLGVSSESEVNEISQLFSDFADGCLSVPIKLQGFAYDKAMKTRKSIISKINRIMEIHGQKSSPEIGNGVLRRLLDEESIPDKAVADFIINLLFAGNETTAKTMLFAVYFLTQFPKAMNQLLDAIDLLQGHYIVSVSRSMTPTAPKGGVEAVAILYVGFSSDYDWVFLRNIVIKTSSS